MQSLTITDPLRQVPLFAGLSDGQFASAVGTRKGDSHVESEPVDIRFRVYLPMNAPDEGRATP